MKMWGHIGKSQRQFHFHWEKALWPSWKKGRNFLVAYGHTTYIRVNGLQNFNMNLFVTIGPYWTQIHLKLIFMKLKFWTLNNGPYMNFGLVDGYVCWYIYGHICEFEI